MAEDGDPAKASNEEESHLAPAKTDGAPAGQGQPGGVVAIEYRDIMETPFFTARETGGSMTVSKWSPQERALVLQQRGLRFRLWSIEVLGMLRL